MTIFSIVKDWGTWHFYVVTYATQSGRRERICKMLQERNRWDRTRKRWWDPNNGVDHVFALQIFAGHQRWDRGEWLSGESWYMLWGGRQLEVFSGLGRNILDELSLHHICPHDLLFLEFGRSSLFLSSRCSEATDGILYKWFILYKPEWEKTQDMYIFQSTADLTTYFWSQRAQWGVHSFLFCFFPDQPLCSLVCFGDG